MAAAVIPADWRERIEHARRIAEGAAQRETAWIARYRPLRTHTATLRLR